MRKCLLLVALLICAQWNGLKAQTLFDLPSDTVCIRQQIQIQSYVTNASSYYWGFCSGYLLNPVVVTNQGAGFNLDVPNAIEVAKDGNNYYGFVVNRGTGELLRYSYGNSLGNTPQVASLGNLEGNVPTQPNNLFMLNDNGTFFLFITGGSGITSSFTRVDFGASLANTPNSVNFGNVGNVLNNPTGVFVAKDGSSYYGFITNAGDDKLIRLAFGSNVSLTPVATDLGTLGGVLSGPSDIAGVLDNGFWYLFITNETGNSLTRIDLGNTLVNGPAAVPIASVAGTLFGPSGISIIRDCGETHAYITNRISSDITKVEMPSFTGAYTATNLGGFAGSFANPADISRIIRDKDNLYAYVVNAGNNSLTQLAFQQCTNASIPSSTQSIPPAFTYDTPGFYNIYLAINEGLPTAQVQCYQVRVLPIPPITISNDTSICQNDTAFLLIQSPDAIRYTWSPNYRISDTDAFQVYVYPEYSVRYMINIPYPNGCIVDTAININVRKVHADAGYDRLLADGSGTLLGGPLTSIGSQYTYEWFPDQYMNNAFIPTPKVNPANDLTYYLKVSDNTGCADLDTVVVHVDCNDLNLPNAFAPESSRGGSNTFGIMNRQIVQLNYFSIFDRWGKKVFTTTDPTKRWDGKVNDEPAPVGVYVWEADGFCISQKHFVKSGNVTLLR